MRIPVESVDELTEAQHRARIHLADIDRWRERQVRERREARKQGKLEPRLLEGIYACTPKQLREVIRVARKEVLDYKRAPELQEIRLYRNSKLLAYAHKNKLFCLELRPCGKNCRRCPHGPYVYSYKRNGKFYPQKKEPNFSRLPTPIRDRFEPIITRIKNTEKSHRPDHNCQRTERDLPTGPPQVSHGTQGHRRGDETGESPS
jgi:hypothetical protein